MVSNYIRYKNIASLQTNFNIFFLQIYMVASFFKTNLLKFVLTNIIWKYTAVENVINEPQLLSIWKEQKGASC